MSDRGRLALDQLGVLQAAGGFLSLEIQHGAGRERMTL